MNRKTIAVRQFVAISLACFAALFVVAKCTACFPADKTIEAAGGYEAQQLACVDRYATRPEIDACRNKVKAAWAAGDAGGDL